MNSKVLFILAVLLTGCTSLLSGERYGSVSNSDQLITPGSIFLQSGNLNTVFRNDGIFNYDKTTFSSATAGLVWPVSSVTRLSPMYSSGLIIGGKYNLSPGVKELRLAASFYSTHYSPGNIPVIGQVPPVSVCNDSVFKGYLVSVTDPSLVNGGLRTKVAGGRTYNFNYSPWSAWPVSLGAPYVEVNGIPGYQPGWNEDRPGTGNGNARPSEMIFTVFMDYTNCTNGTHVSELSLPGGTLPLGVEIQQLSYAFDIEGFRDSYFVRYKIINKSAKTWDSTYIGLINDADLGDPNDDAIGCDSTKNIGYTYNFDNSDVEYGVAPPAIGCKVLQGPVVYTGLNSDTAFLPCNTLVGYKMRMMSGHSGFLNGSSQCTGDPDDAASAFNYLRGMDGCGNPQINYVTGNTTRFRYSGNACFLLGWYDSTSGDKRNMVNIGPFNMNSGDTQVVVYLYTIAKGVHNRASVCDLLNVTDNIAGYYRNCFNLIGIAPIGSIVPEKFGLSQNYPNPFNPVTNIQFEVPKQGMVKLLVFDALGREITALVNQNMDAGSYKVDWDAAEYPSGIYFYRLESGDFTQTRKMILIK